MKNTNEMIAVMSAWNGKCEYNGGEKSNIQFITNNCKDYGWRTALYPPTWNWYEDDYRVNPDMILNNREKIEILVADAMFPYSTDSLSERRKMIENSWNGLTGILSNIEYVYRENDKDLYSCCYEPYEWNWKECLYRVKI